MCSNICSPCGDGVLQGFNANYYFKLVFLLANVSYVTQVTKVVKITQLIKNFQFGRKPLLILEAESQLTYLFFLILFRVY